MKNIRLTSFAFFRAHFFQVHFFFWALCSSLILFFPETNEAQKIVPSEKTFLTLETPHFSVIYDAEQQSLGEHYAQQLERAYHFLKPKFQITPDKTTVLIQDTTDSTNGYATPLPYPHMVIYPVLPVSHEALGEMSHWSLEVLVHEYTHILSFYPATGFMRALKKIFGNVIAPNILLPRWWLEGVAVYNESTVAQGGRLRSIYQESVLRAMTEDKTLLHFSMDEINEILPTWPSSRPYLFGSLFWSSAIEKTNESLMNDLTQEHAGRVPYFIEGPARKHLGASYVHFYEESLRKIEDQLLNQMNTLKRAPLSNQTKVDFNAFISSNDPRLLMSMAPQFSADGKHLAFIAMNEYLERSVQIYTRDQTSTPLSRPRPLNSVDSIDESSPARVMDSLPVGAIQRVSWFNKQNKIIYDKIDRSSSTESFSDLYAYDVQNKKTKKLTTRLRAREPHVSPDDSKVVFIQLSGGQTNLAVLDLATSQVTKYLTSNFDESFSQPLFWSEDEIVFSHRLVTGQEVLQVFSVSARQLKTLHADFPPARFPTKFQGDLYFLSGRNGVFNVYKSKKMQGPPEAMTHVSTSVLSYTSDPQTNFVVASVITSQGPQIKNIQNPRTPRELPRIDKIFQPASRPPAPSTFSDSTSMSKEFFVSSPRPYSPWGYLIPQYWIPWIGTSSSHSGVIFQAATGSYDPLQKHVYSLTVSYDSYLRRGSGQFTYLNNTMEPSFLFASNQQTTFLADPGNLWSTQNYSFSFLPDLFPLSSLLSSHIGVYFKETEVFEKKFRALGFQALLGLSDARMSLAQVTPDEGYNLLLGIRQGRDQNLDADLTQIIFSGNYFESRGLPRFHGLRLRVSSLITTTEVSSFYGRPSQTFPGAADDILMRGYSTGQFFGRTLFNGTAEYQFPLFNIYRGSGTDPIFLRRFHGAFVYDHLRLDGFTYNQARKSFQSVNTGDSFSSVGAEAKLDLTLGYVLPLQFVLGYYQPLDPSLTKDSSIYALQVRGMGLP
jgi:hypothetical protein